MGYPMTYQRVIHRNGLAEGGYGAPAKHATFPGPEWFNKGVDYVAVLREHIELIETERDAAKARTNLLLGDLRRLETDTVDENAACKHIARTTGIDADVVAAVLAEFMRW